MRLIATILLIFISFFSFSVSFAEGNTGATNNQEEIKKIKLVSFKEIAKDKIKLEFDKKINKESDIDISIRNTKDNKEDFVTDIDVKDNVVILKLENDLESNNEYEIIIFLIEAQDGSTITSALDGAVKFVVGDLSIYDNKQENTSTGTEIQENNIEDKNIELNSAGSQETNTGIIKEENSNLAGRELKKEELEQQVEEVAAKKEKLVKTGPEHILLLILAFILAGLVGYTMNKRKKGEI